MKKNGMSYGKGDFAKIIDLLGAKRGDFKDVPNKLRAIKDGYIYEREKKAPFPFHNHEGTLVKTYSGTECCICFEELDHENTVKIHSCIHTFHKKCIIEWARNDDSCPLCKLYCGTLMH